MGPVDTALREAHEEVNIPPEAVHVIGSLGVHNLADGADVDDVLGSTFVARGRGSG